MEIEVSRRVLSNGMRVLCHSDYTTPLVAFNLLYDVGSKDENPEHTGLAHLFEHLMFSGSKKYKDYDYAIESVGGENNAFTNNDFTNYYVQIAKEHLEKVFDIESDRMQNLILSKSKIDVQKNVVCEEYKERYLNKPYGDTSLIIRPMVYKKHPYSWSTIGKELSHIEDMPKEHIKLFYDSYYIPNNAILVVAGPVGMEEVEDLANKYFANISSGVRPIRTYSQEAIQQKERRKEVERKVPQAAIYKVFHICPRMDTDFYCFDLATDILSLGKSSRMYSSLVSEKRLFSSVNAYVSADIEPGTLTVCGYLNKDTSFETAEAAIDEELEKFAQKVEERELEKVKNKAQTSLLFSNLKVLDRATNLAYFELMSKAEDISLEMQKYEAVSKESIAEAMKKYIKRENSSCLYYKNI